MKEGVDPKSFVDLAMAVLTGSIIAKIKKSTWASMLGVGLIFWYLIDLVQRIRILFGIQMYQFDMQEIYIIIDILTLTYLLYVKLNPMVRPVCYKLMWLYAIIWFLVYTFIDVFIAPPAQPNNILFHFSMIAIAANIISIVLWNEIIKNKMTFGELFKW
jgi:hypothetical protein